MREWQRAAANTCSTVWHNMHTQTQRETLCVTAAPVTLSHHKSLPVRPLTRPKRSLGDLEKTVRSLSRNSPQRQDGSTRGQSRKFFWFRPMTVVGLDSLFFFCWGKTEAMKMPEERRIFLSVISSVPLGELPGLTFSLHVWPALSFLGRGPQVSSLALFLPSDRPFASSASRQGHLSDRHLA